MRKAKGAACWKKDRSSVCFLRGEDNIYLSVVNIGQNCWTGSTSDLSVVLSPLRSTIKVVSRNGERQIPVEDFYDVNGDCILESGEIVTEIFIPNMPQNATTVYIKDKRSTSDFAIVSMAMLVELDPDKHTCKHIKVALGGVAPKPISVEKSFDSANGFEVREVITEELLKDVRVVGPATDFKVNEAKMFIKNGLELSKSERIISNG